MTNNNSVDFEKESNEKKFPMNFKNTLGIVIGIHIIVVIGISISSHNLKAKTNEDDEKFIISNESKYVGIEPEEIKQEEIKPEKAKQEEIKPTEVSKNDFPRPDAPMVKTMPKTNETKIAESVPKPTPQQQAKNTETKTKSKYTQTYQVKQGDTINSIAKKYRLVTERLMKINNIKDPNKIYVGQTLKFF
jgi:LysM repeat protein